MQIPSPFGAVTIDCDLANGELKLQLPELTVSVRRWTWGERRRLLESAVAGEEIDVEAFVAGFGELLCEPAPPLECRLLVAHLALSSFSGPPSHELPTLARSEVELARAFGWTPSVIDVEPAEMLDRLLLELSPKPTVRPLPSDDGWTRIVVSDD